MEPLAPTTPPMASAAPAVPEVAMPAVPHAGTALPDDVLLYDGVCGLCAAAVQWVLDHEASPTLRFAPLQGETAARLRAAYPNIPDDIDTVVYVDGGRAYLRTRALLRVARHLRAPWRWGYHLRWLPAVVLDLGYRLVARVRYRIWGKLDACRLPTPAERARVLP
jgi:predicted DCC family thiol-disulfide oxidoreductase YuxK